MVDQPREDLREAAEQLWDDMMQVSVGEPLGWLAGRLVFYKFPGTEEESEEASITWLITPLPDGRIPVENARSWTRKEIDAIMGIIRTT